MTAPDSLRSLSTRNLKIKVCLYYTVVYDIVGEDAALYYTISSICRVATKAVYYQGFGLLHGPTAIGTSQLFFCCKFLVVGPTQNSIGDNADTFHNDSIGLRQEQWRE